LQLSTTLQCHHCGHTAKTPKKCPECQAEGSFIALGPGVERLEEEIGNFLPEAKVLTLSSDTVESVKKLKKVFAAIENHEVDIIIGTQMVAKGHHFPALTLVGIIDIDSGLIGGDFRGAERTFQLLQQVSGRAGREKLAGKVIIQTFQPESRVIRTFLAGNRNEFIDTEMQIRDENTLPPFGRMGALIISGKREDAVRRYCTELSRSAPIMNGVRILGPAPAPLTLLRGKFRYRFLLKTGRRVNIQKIIRDWLDSTPAPSALKVKIDIDPYSFV
jgi:primosomal protein N' (replication factor Y)